MCVIFIIILILCTFTTLLVFKRVKKAKPSKLESTNPSVEQLNANTKQKYILFDLTTPFIPDVHDVVYVENEYNLAINEYIQEHYEEIQQQFLSKKATFIYLPKLCGQEVSKEVLHYMFPFLRLESSFVNGDLTIETLKSHILSGSIED